MSDPSPAPVEDYRPARVLQKYYAGSVFSLARKMGDEEGDDSSVISGGVEVIVSELENITQVSDSSLQLSARECEEPDLALSSKFPAEDARKSIVETSLRVPTKDSIPSVSTRQVGKTALRPDNEIAVKAAIVRLIPDPDTREAAIRSVTKAQSRHLYLYLSQGKIQGVYGLDRTALRKVFGAANKGDVVTFSSVKRWLRLEGLGFRMVFGYQYRHADAFEV